MEQSRSLCTKKRFGINDTAFRFNTTSQNIIINLAGFGKLHSVACRQAKQPWIHSKALVIAGSDVALGSWIGCLEGALVDGEVAALKILNEVLFPVKPPKNFIKRIRDINHI